MIYNKIDLKQIKNVCVIINTVLCYSDLFIYSFKIIFQVNQDTPDLQDFQVT